MAGIKATQDKNGVGEPSYLYLKPNHSSWSSSSITPHPQSLFLNSHNFMQWLLNITAVSSPLSKDRISLQLSAQTLALQYRGHCWRHHSWSNCLGSSAPASGLCQKVPSIGPRPTQVPTSLKPLAAAGGVTQSHRALCRRGTAQVFHYPPQKATAPF